MSKHSIQPKKGKVKTETADDRVRNWTTEFYPDSVVDGLEDKLAELHVRAFLSPLHDKDINGNGEPKKPHWHLVLMFSSMKSESQVRDLVKPLGAVGLEKVRDIRVMARYLCHLDNPEKARYSTDEVKQFGGADYIAEIGLASDKYVAIREMIAYIEANDINSYSALVSYAATERDDWFRALCDSSTMVIDKYIKSRFWERYKMQDEIDAHLVARGGELDD